MRAGAFACAVAPLKFSALAKPMNLPVLWQRCDRFATAPLQLRQMAHPLREMKAQSGDDCVDPSPTLSAPALMIALGTCRARWGLRLRAHGTGDRGSRNRGERGSVMEIQEVCARLRWGGTEPGGRRIRVGSVRCRYAVV